MRIQQLSGERWRAGLAGLDWTGDCAVLCGAVRCGALRVCLGGCFCGRSSALILKFSAIFQLLLARLGQFRAEYREMHALPSPAACAFFWGRASGESARSAPHLVSARAVCVVLPDGQFTTNTQQRFNFPSVTCSPPLAPPDQCSSLAATPCHAPVLCTACKSVCALGPFGAAYRHRAELQSGVS